MKKYPSEKFSNGFRDANNGLEPKSKSKEYMKGYRGGCRFVRKTTGWKKSRMGWTWVGR